MHQDAFHNRLDVVVVEDDAATLAALKVAIEAEPRLRLVAAFDSVAPTLAWLERGRLDLLLTDLGLPDGSGVEIIRSCLHHSPECNVMVITMSDDEASILASIEAGASGYVLKDAGAQSIAQTLLELHAGGSPISPIAARKLFGRMRESCKNLTPQFVATKAEGLLLTQRESAILELIARGDSYVDVARTLMLSVNTVQTHVKNIYAKLSVHSRGTAVFEAQRCGLLRMEMVQSPSAIRSA